MTTKLLLLLFICMVKGLAVNLLLIMTHSDVNSATDNLIAVILIDVAVTVARIYQSTDNNDMRR